MKEFLFHTLHYWSAGGLLLIPLAGVCAGIWGYFLRSRDRMVWVLRGGEELERSLAGGALGGTDSAGPLGDFLSRAITDIHSGSPAREAFHVREAECMEGLRRDLVILAALTAIAPLLGLLGTVIGMIHTFEAVSRISGETGVRVADGISQALITTQFGLVVAVPGLFGISRLRSLLRDVQVKMGSIRAQALTLLEHGEDREAA